MQCNEQVEVKKELALGANPRPQNIRVKVSRQCGSGCSPKHHPFCPFLCHNVPTEPYKSLRYHAADLYSSRRLSLFHPFLETPFHCGLQEQPSGFPMVAGEHMALQDTIVHDMRYYVRKWAGSFVEDIVVVVLGAEEGE